MGYRENIPFLFCRTFAVHKTNLFFWRERAKLVTSVLHHGKPKRIDYSKSTNLDCRK